MILNLETPFKEKWNKGYLVTNKKSRKHVVLFNNNNDRTTTSYARYLMGVKLGYEVPEELQVDHIDEDKTNDIIENLQVLSSTEHVVKSRLRQSKNKTTVHGSLAMYKYCKCDLCRLGKKLYSAGKKEEYRQLIQQAQQ